MTDLKPSPIPRTAPPPPKLPRRLHLPIWAYIAMAAALALALVPTALIAGSNSETRVTNAEGKTSAVVEAAAPALYSLDDLCKQQGDLGDKLRSQTTLCPQAGKAKAVISDQAPPPVSPGAGLTTGQVQDMIGNALAGQPRPLTIDQVAAKATEIYTTLDAATPSKISAAVAALCANDACRGKQGNDAPPVTDAQLLAQVTAYCEAREDKCVGRPGKTGDQGKQGVSFQRQYFARDGSGQCFSYVESYDPATNGTTTASERAGDAACSEPPPSATPTPSDTPGG
jgi:hypothetical protein